MPSDNQQQNHRNALSGPIDLPAAQTVVCANLCSNLSRLRPFIPHGIDERQFFAALIAEVNQLKEDTTPRSVLIAAHNLCLLGLLPGATLGHAYLVAYNNQQKDGTWLREASVQVGYKGFLHLAYGMRWLRDISPEVILKNEEVERWHDADGPQIKHRLPIDRNPVAPNTLSAAYVTWHTTSGGRGLKLIPATDILAIQAKSAKRSPGGFNPWRDNFEAMCLKTPVRRAANYWPRSNQLALASKLDEQVDAGERQTCDVVPDQKQAVATSSPTRLLENVLAGTLGLNPDQFDAECQSIVGKTFDEVRQSEDLSRGVIESVSRRKLSNGNSNH